MRKSLILLAVLLVLSLGGGIAGAVVLDRQQDSITVTQKALYGDPSAVADLQVMAGIGSGSNLYWQTASTAGADTRTETVFSFYPRGRDWTQYADGSRFDLSISSVNYSMSGVSNLEAEENGGDWGRYDAMLRPAMDVASRTAAGETRTEVCNLRSYYEYLKVTADYQLPGLDGSDRMAVLKALNQVFRIPVPAQCPVEVTVTKDENGQVCQVECNDIGEDEEGSVWSVWTSAVCTDRGVWLVMGGQADFSQIETGYGVWLLPYGENDKGRYLDVANLVNIYPLDAAAVTEASIQASWDGSRIYLLTRENGEAALTVLDCASDRALQRLPLGQEPVEALWTGETAAAVLCGEEANYSLQVFADDGGTLTPWLQTGLYPLNQAGETYWKPALFFDGERLVLGSFQDGWQLASFRLTAYDRNGLLYAGDYTSSADSLPGHPFTIGDTEMQIRRIAE